MSNILPFKVRTAELNTANLQDLAQSIYTLLYTGIQQQINTSVVASSSLTTSYEVVSSTGSNLDSLQLTPILPPFSPIFVPTGSTLLSPYGTSVIVSSTRSYFLPALFQTGTSTTQITPGRQKAIRLQDSRAGNATVALGSYSSPIDFYGSVYGVVNLSPTQPVVYLTFNLSSTGGGVWVPDALTNMGSSGNITKTVGLGSSVPYFGFDVACDGSGKISIIGEPGNTGSNGLVAVYNNNQLTNIITGTNNNNLGQFVACNINSQTIVAGAPGITGTNNTGTIYAYYGGITGGYNQIFSSSGPIFLGYYMDISADGTVMVAGSPTTSQAFIYKLTTNSGSLLQTINGTGQFGYSVSIAGDKSVIAVGNPTDNTNIGSIYIYSQTATGNYTLLQNISGTGNIGTSNQGSSLTVSGNGQTIVAGGPNDNSGIGASWVYQRTSTVLNSPYTFQQKLIGYGYTGTPNQGFDCTLSGDGNSLVVDASQNNGGIGGVFLFNRPAGTNVWSQSSFLTPTNNIGNGQFGFGVAINSNGSSTTIGSPFDNNGIGAYYQTF